MLLVGDHTLQYAQAWLAGIKGLTVSWRLRRHHCLQPRTRQRQRLTHAQFCLHADGVLSWAMTFPHLRWRKRQHHWFLMGKSIKCTIEAQSTTFFLKRNIAPHITRWGETGCWDSHGLGFGYLGKNCFCFCRKKIFLSFFKCMECFAYIYIKAPCVCSTHGSQKMALDPQVCSCEPPGN